jgi:hypothetical protein
MQRWVQNFAAAVEAQVADCAMRSSAKIAKNGTK